MQVWKKRVGSMIDQMVEDGLMKIDSYTDDGEPVYGFTPKGRAMAEALGIDTSANPVDLDTKPSPD
jgi:hypothetical protein